MDLLDRRDDQAVLLGREAGQPAAHHVEGDRAPGPRDDGVAHGAAQARRLPTATS